MRFLKVSLIILVLFITTSFPVTAGFDVAPWPMYQHDIFQNGSSPFPGPDGLSKELLKKQVGAVTSSPVVGFGRKIYVGSSDGKIYEVTLDGSAPKVIYTTGACIDSTPAVTADGMLYVGSNDGFLYAVVLSTKSLAWKLRLGTAVKSSPIVTSTGKIFVVASVSADEGALFRIDASGTIDWQQPIGKVSDPSSPIFDTAAPAVDMAGNVYITSGDTINGYKLSAFRNNASGTLINEKLFADEMITSSPVIGSDGSTVYIATMNLDLSGFDIKDIANLNFSSLRAYYINGVGELVEKWSYTPKFPITGLAVALIDTAGEVLDIEDLSQNIPTAFLSAPAVGIDGDLYIGCAVGALFCIDKQGKQKWVTPLMNVNSIISGILANPQSFMDDLETDPMAVLKYINPIMTSPITDGDDGAYYRIYVRSGNTVFAFKNSGEEIGTKFQAGEADIEDNLQRLSCLALGGDRVIYLSSTDGDIYGIGAADSNHSISGTISGDSSVTNIEVYLTGPQVGSVIVDAGQQYEFNNLMRGNYIVSPIKAGVEFSPSGKIINNLNGDVTQDFTISGDVNVPPEITAYLDPPFLFPGTEVLMVVNITSPGTGTVDSASFDLSSIGGSSSAAGELNPLAGGSYCFAYDVPGDTTPGLKEIIISVKDSNGLVVQEVLTLDVINMLHELVTDTSVHYVTNDFEGQTLVLTYYSSGGDLLLQVFEPSDSSITPSYSSTTPYEFIMTSTENVSFVYNAVAGIWKYVLSVPSVSTRVNGSSPLVSREGTVETSTAGTGVIFGKILAAANDDNGIEEVNISTGTGGGTRSETGGIYSFQTSAGSFRLTASKIGFNNASKSVDLFTGAVKNVDMIMQPGTFNPDPPSTTCFLSSILGLRSANVSLLRSYRDRVLKKSASGNAYIDKYYRYSPEIVEITEMDPDIKDDVRENVRGIINLVLRGLFGLSSSMNDLQKARAINCLERIKERAGPELAQELDALIEDIKSGELVESFIQ